MGNCLQKLFNGSARKSKVFAKASMPSKQKEYPKMEMVGSFFLQDTINAPSNFSIQIRDTACLVSNVPDEEYSKKLIFNYQVKHSDLDESKDPFSQRPTARVAKKSLKNQDSEIRTKAKSTFQKPIAQKPMLDQEYGSLHRPQSGRRAKHRQEDLQLFNNDREKLDNALLQQNQDKYYETNESQDHYEPLKEKQLPSKIQWTGTHVIGQGSFGKVLFGMNLSTGQQMAVKQVELNGISKNDARIKALEVEINLLSKFEHKNIVSYYGMERTDKNINIFLEYVGAGSLSQLIKNFGPLQEQLIKVYIQEILNGLNYLHKNGIMHRDIKGANVLVEKSGHCKLADFGSGKYHELLQPDQCNSLCGTPNWMAPEVMEQDTYGRKADIWSVGCTMIELATAKPPWGVFSNPFTALFQISAKKSPPPIPDHLTDTAKDFLSVCFQLDPRKRWTAKRLLNHAWFQTTSVDGMRPRNSSRQSMGSMTRSRTSSMGPQFIRSISKISQVIEIKKIEVLDYYIEQDNEVEIFNSLQSKEFLSPPQVIKTNAQTLNNFDSTGLDSAGKSQQPSSRKFSKFYSPKSPPKSPLLVDASLKLIPDLNKVKSSSNFLLKEPKYNYRSFEIDPNLISLEVNRQKSLTTMEQKEDNQTTQYSDLLQYMNSSELIQKCNVPVQEPSKKLITSQLQMNLITSQPQIFTPISEDPVSQEQETEQLQQEYELKSIPDSDHDLVSSQIIQNVELKCSSPIKFKYEFQQQNMSTSTKLNQNKEEHSQPCMSLTMTVDFQMIHQYSSQGDEV